MYRMALRGDSCLVIIMAVVTAGLMWAPDTLAKADVSMAAARPDAMAVLI